jgi:ABC-type branched-subunit amino acid transport system substrate-binding protein
MACRRIKNPDSRQRMREQLHLYSDSAYGVEIISFAREKRKFDNPLVAPTHGQSVKTTLISIMTAGWLLAAEAQTLGLPANGPIVLGQSAPLSGSFGVLGKSYRDGARLYFDKVNRQGGVHGREIRLQTLDDAYDALRAENNTKRLIQEDRVFALFGHMFSSAVKASLEVASQGGVPYIAPYAGYDELFERRNPVLFMTRASFGMEMDTLLRHAHAMGLRRVALVRYDSKPGKVLQQEFETKLAALGLKPLGIGIMKLNSRDPTAAVRQLVDTLPNGIVLGVSGADAVEFIKTFNASAKAMPIQYLARSLVGGHQLVAELGRESRGIVMTQLAPSPFNGKTRVAREYQADLKSARNEKKEIETSYLGFEGYIAAKIMVEGLKRAGPNPTRAGLITALESMRDWDGGDFFVNYSPTNHNGSRFVTVTVIGPSGHFIE